MTITRVQYRERQRLVSSDLLAEQDYRLGWMGRHHLGPHQWGVVRGLWLLAQQARYSRRWVVTPGMAIDGYGRELFVASPLEFVVEDPEQAWFVVLYYCEAPVSVPPCAPCREDPAPRIGQYVQVKALHEFQPIAREWSDLASARAAGSVPGQPTWPVLLGIVTPSNFRAPVDYSRTRYVRHRSALLKSPAGMAALRLGLSSQGDLYHFLLWTRQPAGTSINRLGIDRNATVHVWKPLVLTGPEASGYVPVSARAALSIKTQMPAGIGRRVLLRGRVADPRDPTLDVTWLDSLGARVSRAVSLRERGRVFLDRELRFVGEHPVTFRLESKLGNRLSVLQPKRKGEEQRLLVQEFEAELTPSGGRLELYPLKASEEPDVNEGALCDSPVVGAESVVISSGPFLRLTAGKGHVPGPATREMYTESVPLPDDTPTTELCVSGGALDGGDRSDRVAFGVRNNEGAGVGAQVWHSLLAMDGGGRISMPAPETQLTVEHTLHLPSIKPDPADPLGQDLLALAYIAGLRRSGRVKRSIDIPAAITLVTPPNDPLSDNQDVTYKLKIAPSGAQLPLTIKRCLELAVGTDPEGSRDVTLRTVPEVVGELTATRDFLVTVKNFHHRARKILLGHELLVNIEDKDWAVSSLYSDLDVDHT